MSAAAYPFTRTRAERNADESPRPTLTIQPSARTLETTAAADQFRAQVDGLKLEYRLTAGELQLILAGEITRAARAEVEFERATGNTRPLALRFIKPASEDARVADADELEELLDGD